MTTAQTRQLQIEFERRLYEIHPEFATTLKLSSDTIFSFLSEYQVLYVNLMISLMSSLESQDDIKIRVNDILKELIKHRQLLHPLPSEDKDTNSEIFRLPDDYYIYIRSNSMINKNYKTNVKYATSVSVPNKTIKHADVEKVLDTYYNNRSILRNPLVVLESDDDAYLKVIHDSYTHITGLDLVYYSKPYSFNIMKYNDANFEDGAVHSYCLLPYSCFWSFIEGAVEMYIKNYKLMLNSKPSKQNQKEDDK